MLSKFKEFRNDMKQTLDFGREEKKLFTIDIVFKIVQSIVGSIFPLFMAIGVSIFTEHKLLGLVLIIINLTGTIVSKTIDTISLINQEKFEALDLKNQERFVGKMLNKVRGKVIIEDGGVKQTMSSNNITETLKMHYSFLFRVLNRVFDLGIRFITSIVALFAIVKTVPDGKGLIFFAISVMYLVIYLISIHWEMKIRHKGNKEAFKYRCKRGDAVRDIVEIEPISNSHSDFLFNRTLRMMTEEMKISFKVRNKNSCISLGVNFIYVLFDILLVLYMTLSAGIDNLTIEQVVYAISVSQILNSLVNCICGIFGNYKSIIEIVKDNENNEKLYSEIKKTFYSEKKLKEFKGDQITLKPFKFKYPTGDYELESPNEITFKRGELVLIKGDSGVGKSTLMKIASGELGNLQDCYINKVVYFNDRSDLGSANLLDEITFDDSKGNVNHELLNEILTNLKLSDLDVKSELRNTISNGMRQRVLLARALYNLNDADLICMDEPIGSLDEDNAKEVIKFVKDFCNRDKKRFIIMCSHQYGIISDLIDNEYKIIKTKNHSRIDG